MYGPGDVRVEQVPDPVLQAPTDAIVRVTLACVCGSDLHPYHSMPASAEGVPMGHEFIGVVEQVGDDVTGLTEGDLVISPFAFSDNTCVFCREGVHTSCVHGGFYAAGGVGGAQAEKVRVPQAQGTLVKIPSDVDPALLPSLLTLSDVEYHGRLQSLVVIGVSGFGLAALPLGVAADATSLELVLVRMGACVGLISLVFLVVRSRQRRDLADLAELV